MRLSDLKIGTKLGSAFLAVISLTIGMGVFAVVQLATINANTIDIATNWLPSIKELGAMDNAMNKIRRTENDAVLNAGGGDAAAIEKTFAEWKGKLAEEQGKYEHKVTPGAERDGYEQYQRHLTAFFVTHDKLMLLVRDGEKSLQQTKAYLWGDSRSAFNTTLGDLGQLIEINDKGADAAYKTAEATYSRVRIWVIVLLACAIIIAALMAVWITRLITVPIARAVGAAERIADGDLTVELQSDGKDETAQLLRALGGMKDNLAGIVRGVRSNAESVATASGQIAQGNLDLSSRTEEQASALEETAATMEELSTTVRNNSDSAKQANQLATDASGVAARGGVVVTQVVDRMKDINQSSKKIADIISVIDGIAFQTNLLALNAAVEAARAGEQGRGFAVVAGEVRNLAGRSADAAKEIKALITNSVEQIEQGSALADQAGQTMEEIVGAIKRVNVIVGEISNASAEQSNGVTQVGQAVTQMDQATQQNAALVEESAAAAESLKQQAQELVQAVGVFKLSETGSPAGSPALPAAAPVYSGPERRGPNRATNVTRPRFAAKPTVIATVDDTAPFAASEALKTASNDWQEF
jgi:methyl-accepting chemotaxis protein